MRLRGKGILTMRLDHPAGEEVARISVDSEAWTDCKANFTPVSGVHALYFTVESGVRIACQHFCFPQHKKTVSTKHPMERWLSP